MHFANKTGLIIGVALMAVVAGCGSKDGPSGQVVATVDGTDITVHELNSEIRLAQVPPNVPRKIVEQAALDRIIERKMLSVVAKKQGLDKNPEFLLSQQRTEEGLLVQALQASIQQKVQPVADDVAEKFVNTHPMQFGERRIYAIDQIQFLRPTNIDQIGLQAAKTMNDVERILLNNNLEFRRQPGSMDTLAIAPALTAEIAKIYARNPAEVFIFTDQPRGAPAPIVYVNAVTSVKTDPYLGVKAKELALQSLQREALTKALVDALKQYKLEMKDKIVYAKGYNPPLPPAKSLPNGTVVPAAPAAAQ